jgi:hypothetical protein
MGLYVFNTTRLDKEYTLADLKRLMPVTTPEYGLEDGFYGGRVTHIGETDTGVLLLINDNDGLHLVDTASVDLNNIPTEVIRNLAERRKLIPSTVKASKEKLIELITQNRRWREEDREEPKIVEETRRVINNVMVPTKRRGRPPVKRKRLADNEVGK